MYGVLTRCKLKWAEVRMEVRRAGKAGTTRVEGKQDCGGRTA